MTEKKCNINLTHISSSINFKDDIDMIRTLIGDCGADPNVKDNDGNTPLHQAARKGSTAIVRLLVAEFRADVNAVNEDGWTPLHFAIDEEKIEVAELLLFGEDQTVDSAEDAANTSNWWE